MVLYLVRIDLPSAQAEAFSRFQAPHVALAVAAMGRDAVCMRAKASSDGERAQFVWVFELPSLSRLEGYLTSREHEELATELMNSFPEAKVWQSFGELAGGIRRGLRFGETPAAALVVDVALPADTANGWVSRYEQDQVPQILTDAAFVRARRFELHSDNGESRHLMIFDAVNREALENLKEGGQRGDLAVQDGRIERQVWEWLA